MYCLHALHDDGIANSLELNDYSIAAFIATPNVDQAPLFYADRLGLQLTTFPQFVARGSVWSIAEVAKRRSAALCIPILSEMPAVAECSPFRSRMRVSR